jgi:cyclic pyranopterin phosphate synthase
MDESSREDESDTSDQLDEISGDQLTHIDQKGSAQMVDIGGKQDTKRTAISHGQIHLQSSTIQSIQDNEVGKGNVISVARVSAIQAVKYTWETIPMCHQIPITNVDTQFSINNDSIELEITVQTLGKTGCEMEALQGVTTGLNTIWDMVKAVEKDDNGQYPDTSLTDIEIVSKEK